MASPPARLGEHVASGRLWAVSQQPYLAAALFALTLVPTEGLDTFGVDRGWRLFADPACATRWTVEETGAVLIHEVHHLLRDHAGRAKALDVPLEKASRFNIAADLEINDDLGDLPLPATPCLPEQFRLQPGLLAEEYFGALDDAATGGWGDCGAAAHGHGGPEPDGLSISDGEASLIRQQVAQEVRRLAQAGRSPGEGMARWAESFLTPVVDWRRQLAGLVRRGTGYASGRVDYSYARPSRRYALRTTGVVQPSLVAPVPDVAVVIDTSGSMDGHLLGQAVAEVEGLLRANGISGQHLRILSCDTEVHLIQRVRSSAEITLLGGGGTTLEVGLEAAAALRPRPSVLVVLTDGGTPWPEAKPAIATVVVALLEDEAPQPPDWANVVRIPGTRTARV